MGFIERLEQEEITKTQQLRVGQEAWERDRLQKEAIERGRRAVRKEQAEKFREESRVGVAVARLGEFLTRPTIPYQTYETHDGFQDLVTKYRGRGFSKGPITSAGDLPVHQNDPDSVFDTAVWDAAYTKGFIFPTQTNKLYEANSYSEKYIAVESCPDGAIVFHAGWLGSTTIRMQEWRTRDKEQLFDKALERAFKNPGFYKRPFTPPYISLGF